MQVLILAPNIGDYPSKLSYETMVRVYKDAKKLGKDVALLEKNGVNPISFYSFLSFIKPKVKIIVYGGHGTPISWVGQWILLHVLAPYGFGEVPMVKGRILAGVPTCDAGRMLGPIAAKSGAVFVGSIDTMWAGAGPGLSGYKGYDYAKDFMKTWYTFHITLITTGCVEDAYEAYRSLVLELIEKYEEERYNDWEWHAWALNENLRKLRIYYPE